MIDLKLNGIDVSRWQGKVDWQKIKATGKVDFAIIRAGYGRVATQKDTQFENNYKGAKAAGIPIGAYWYSYATTTVQAKQEALACLQVIQGKQFEYPIWFDQEYEKGIVALDNATRTAICKAFCDELEKAGYYTGIYCSSDWMNTRLNYKELSAYDHWAAHYGKECTSKHEYGIWQYSSTNALKIPGYLRSLDCNYCYKNYPAIIKGAGLNGYKKESAKRYTGTIKAVKAVDKKILDDEAKALGITIQWKEE